MPNWCDNRLRVSGERAELDRFVVEVIAIDKHGRECLDFEKVVPIGDVEDWYKRRLNGWGTKWNLCSEDFSMDDAGGCLSMWFLTAWSPPVPICYALTEKYPALSFEMKYDEGGMAFGGIFESVCGVVHRDECWDTTKIACEDE